MSIPHLIVRFEHITSMTDQRTLPGSTSTAVGTVLLPPFPSRGAPRAILHVTLSNESDFANMGRGDYKASGQGMQHLLTGFRRRQGPDEPNFWIFPVYMREGHRQPHV